MSMFRPLYRSSILMCGLILCAGAQAKDRIVYGSLDDFSKNEIVISDRAFPVSKLVSCYDERGRTIVGCSGLTKIRWVEITINEDGFVSKLKQLTDEQYKKVGRNDD